jgi:hypothetical protein
MEGDTAAGKLLLTYALGRAAAAPDPDGADLDEWRRLVGNPTAAEVAAATHDGILPPEAVEHVRIILSGECAPDKIFQEDFKHASRIAAVRRRRLEQGPPRG